MPAKKAPAAKAAAKKTARPRATERKKPPATKLKDRPRANGRLKAIVAQRAPESIEADQPKAPVHYSPELFDRICERIADGDMVVDICREAGMPSKKCFYEWVQQREGCEAKYTLARQIQAHSFVEDTIKISDEKVRSKEDAARQKIRVSARQWYGEKIVPRIYGQKVGIGGADDLPPVKSSLDVDLTLSPAEVYRQVVKGLR